MPNKPKGISIYVAILLIITLGALVASSFQPSKFTDKDYTQVVGYFQQNKVMEYTLDFGTGELKVVKINDPVGPFDYKVPSVKEFLEDTKIYIFAYNLEHPNDPIKGNHKPAQTFPAWVSIVPPMLLIAVLIGVAVLMVKQTRGVGGSGIGGFGKAKARVAQEGRRVTFADVAGADEEKAELVEVVDFLRTPSKYNSLGARIPKGVLLVGPPGTGKTLLARAVAGEADVQFFSISGSDFVEMFVGVGASRVRDLFEQAKKHAPSVVFIDEIDAVGRQRGAGLGGGHDEREQTLNQLLVEMDGFSANTGVIILAATNRRDILDPALLRPGRFDRQVFVGYPDVKGREEILRVHTKNKPLAPDVNLKEIARTTVGFTGADLENLANEAALMAAKKNLKAITMPEIKEATIKVVAGPEKKSRVVTEKDKKITAYHEAGHAVCGYNLETQDPVNQVSVIPRGMAAGYTLSLPDEDSDHVTKGYMYESIVSLMGGRVAEKLILDDISTGASHDIKVATQNARDMVMRYGFSEKVGPIAYAEDRGEVFLGRDYSASNGISEEMAAIIDNEVHVIINGAYEQSMQILRDNEEKLHVLAKYLFINEVVERAEFEQIMEGKLLPAYDPFNPEEKARAEAEIDAAERAKSDSKPKQEAESAAEEITAENTEEERE